VLERPELIERGGQDALRPGSTRQTRGRAAAHLLIAAVVGFGGCAEQPARPRSSAPPINLSGYSPAFKEGFQHGCDAARGTPRRDSKRFEADAQYAQGWQDGRAICGKR
jgi:hypothetical protein